MFSYTVLSYTVDPSPILNYCITLFSKVPAGEAKSVFFPIVPAALGKIPLTVTAQSPLAADGVKRQLLVEVSTEAFQ